MRSTHCLQQETRDDELEAVIKSHSKLNLFAPMPGCGNAKRWLIFDSDMRLRDSFSSKVKWRCTCFTVNSHVTKYVMLMLFMLD